MNGIRHCIDKHPKVVIRTFTWDERQLRIKLCKQHCKDPDFSNFISEIPINQEAIQK